MESALCGIYPCTKIDFARNPCKTAKIKIDLVIVGPLAPNPSPSWQALARGWSKPVRLYYKKKYTPSGNGCSMSRVDTTRKEVGSKITSNMVTRTPLDYNYIGSICTIFENGK